MMTNEKVALENFEWDSTWIEQTGRADGRRVYYVGDSISNALRRECTAAADGEILFDGCATSKALDNPWYHETISLFGSQLPRTDAVLFNNGLHGWHLDDEGKYAEYYEKTVLFLRERFPDAKLILLLTTLCADGDKGMRVVVRNAAVKRIAEKYALPVIDLYSASLNVAARQIDGCHFHGDANRFLAEFLVGEIRKHI